METRSRVPEVEQRRPNREIRFRKRSLRRAEELYRLIGMDEMAEILRADREAIEERVKRRSRENGELREYTDRESARRAIESVAV